LDVLGLVVARGGSKGVPDKNIRVINGLPLIAYKILSAMRSCALTRLIVSTESFAIAEIARSYGAEVPFTRPADLATDSTPSMHVVKHAMNWIEKSGDKKYDALMLLEPSTPFATSVDYDNAIRMMTDKDANVVLGMRETDVNSCFAGPLDTNGRITSIIVKLLMINSHRRQDVHKEYTMNGAFYLAKWDFLKKHNNFYAESDSTYGLPMSRYYSVEIDEIIDLEWARWLVDQGYIDMSFWQG